MEKYPKLFILAAVGYLLAGALFGMGLGMGHVDPGVGRFVHAHFNLLGFMAMFIYGVAYHILPRFNAKPVGNPGLIRIHFYLVNAGLVGMAATALAEGVYGAGTAHALFILFSVSETAGIGLFAYNIIPVIMPEREEEEASPAGRGGNGGRREEKPAVNEEMKISETLQKYPHLAEVFAGSGFKAITNPAALATFAKDITIAKACSLHNVNGAEFISRVNEAVKRGAPAGAPQPAATVVSPQKKAETAMAKGKTIRRGEEAAQDTLIGSLIEAYPETKNIFEKHYGAGCFSCPGQAFETLAQTATMHGMKAEKILGEVNEIIRSVNSSNN